MSNGSVKIEGDFVVIKIKLDQVHGLIVALQECPCKSTKSNKTKELRENFKNALVKANGQK